MSTAIATREELVALKSQGWEYKSSKLFDMPEDIDLENGLGDRKIVKVKFICQSGYDDITARTAGYLVGAPFVLAGSLVCSALCCFCSTKTSGSANGHIESDRVTKFPTYKPHDHKTAEGMRETGDKMSAAALGTLSWNSQFEEKLAPFRAYTVEKVAHETDVTDLFG